MLENVKKLWRDERGVEIIQVVVWTLIGVGAAAMIGYGIAAAMRGLAGKQVLTIKCADPAYADDPRCDNL